MKTKTIVRWVAILSSPIVGMALLFPFFARAREKARTSSCQNNLKQMGIAFAQYNQDYKSFPLVIVGGVHIKASESDVPIGWADALELYTKSR